MIVCWILIITNLDGIEIYCFICNPFYFISIPFNILFRTDKSIKIPYKWVIMIAFTRNAASIVSCLNLFILDLSRINIIECKYQILNDIFWLTLELNNNLIWHQCYTINIFYLPIIYSHSLLCVSMSRSREWSLWNVSIFFLHLFCHQMIVYFFLAVSCCLTTICAVCMMRWGVMYLLRSYL